MKMLNELSVNGYSFPNIDCYHNLLSYSLVSNGYNLGYLGVKWPWCFYINNEGYIQSLKSISHSIIKDVFNIELMYGRFKTNAPISIKKEIENLLTKNSNLIVGVNELPYFKSIRNEKHSIIITYIDDIMAQCIDTIPVFVGRMDTDTLLAGISQVENPWYAFLSYPSDRTIISDRRVFQFFIENINTVIQQYKERDNCMFHTAKHIYERVYKMRMSPDTQTQLLKNMCNGKWGWHIKRNAGLFSAYLGMDYVKKQYGKKIQQIYKLIESISDIWSIMYRQLFMASISSPWRREQLIDKVLIQFLNIMELEEKLIGILLI